jgi:hypothetical protein
MWIPRGLAMETWTADIVTNPDDYRLIVELQQDGQFRAKLFQDDKGALQLRVYDGPDTTIPVDWLVGIIRRFLADLVAMRDRGCN